MLKIYRVFKFLLKKNLMLVYCFNFRCNTFLSIHIPCRVQHVFKVFRKILLYWLYKWEIWSSFEESKFFGTTQLAVNYRTYLKSIYFQLLWRTIYIRGKMWEWTFKKLKRIPPPSMVMTYTACAYKTYILLRHL